MMRKFGVIAFFLFVVFKAFSQQDHFLYLQTEDRLPFYARILNQVYSSSENGYLIIPKLVEGRYQMDIGFAKSAFPEQHFVIQLGNTDLGYQVKNGGSKGWGLYNLKNGEMLASLETNDAKWNDFTGARKTDAFSEMLANIVNDSAILYSAPKPAPPQKAPEKIAKVEEKKDSPVIDATALSPVKQTESPAQVVRDSGLNKANDGIAPANNEATKVALDSTVIVAKQTAPPETKKETAVNKSQPPSPITDTLKNVRPEPKIENAKPPASQVPAQASKEKPFIFRLNESTTPDAYEATYLEQYNLTTDTVKISIPLKDAPPVTKADEEPPKQAVEQPQRQPVPEATATLPVNKPAAAPAKKPALQIINSDCKNFATDYDVDKLRVKIISEDAIEDKLVAAKKYFKTKCFTVKQVRALSELFSSDDTRYQFFDAAYPFISDTSEFHTLEELILNDYYKNRFRAMIHR